MDKINAPSLFQVNSYSENANFIRRFQSHAAFVSLCFDIRRRSHNNSKVYVQTTWNTWPKTRALLEKLTSEELLEAAEQARQYRPITNPVVKELLKAITRVGASIGRVQRKEITHAGRIKVLSRISWMPHHIHHPQSRRSSFAYFPVLCRRED